MMTTMEKAPLRFLRLSEVGLIASIACMLGGLWMLLEAADRMMVFAVSLMSAGVALGFVAGYYRGCGNGACTPRDW